MTTERCEKQPMADRILEFVTAHEATFGYAPSYREIGEAVGLSAVSSVAYQVRMLINAGKLAQGAHGCPRTLRVPR